MSKETELDQNAILSLRSSRSAALGGATMSKSSLSRREFLMTTAGAAGASVAARAIPLEPQPLFAASRAVPPSDRVRFGIVGVGMEGTGLLTTAVALPGVECVAAADLYDGRHELAKEIAGKSIHTTRRYKELLENKEIDAIIIAVPDHWQASGCRCGCRW